MSNGIKMKLERAVPRLSNLLADDTWAKYKWTPDTSLSNEDNLSTLSFAQDKIAFQLKYLTEIREEIDAAQTDWITFLQRIENKEERDAEDNRMGANNTTLKITDILNRTDAMYSQLQAKKFELSLAGQLLHNKRMSPQLKAPIEEAPLKEALLEEVVSVSPRTMEVLAQEATPLRSPNRTMPAVSSTWKTGWRELQRPTSTGIRQKTDNNWIFHSISSCVRTTCATGVVDVKSKLGRRKPCSQRSAWKPEEAAGHWTGQWIGQARTDGRPTLLLRG
ncbi:hypothetical protein Ddc_14345 [Ditylenchus destructor]|nr:hypothetical protein Ddc_14345 [Ditylenchus destructor]